MFVLAVLVLRISKCFYNVHFQMNSFNSSTIDRSFSPWPTKGPTLMDLSSLCEFLSLPSVAGVSMLSAPVYVQYNKACTSLGWVSRLLYWFLPYHWPSVSHTFKIVKQYVMVLSLPPVSLPSDVTLCLAMS